MVNVFKSSQVNKLSKKGKFLKNFLLGGLLVATPHAVRASKCPKGVKVKKNKEIPRKKKIPRKERFRKAFSWKTFLFWLLLFFFFSFLCTFYFSSPFFGFTLFPILVIGFSFSGWSCDVPGVYRYEHRCANERTGRRFKSAHLRRHAALKGKSKGNREGRVQEKQKRKRKEKREQREK